MRGNGRSDHVGVSRCMVHHGLSTGIVLGHLARGQRWTGFSHVGEVLLPRRHESLVRGFHGAHDFDMFLNFSLHARDWQVSVGVTMREAAISTDHRGIEGFPYQAQALEETVKLNASTKIRSAPIHPAITQTADILGSTLSGFRS